MRASSVRLSRQLYAVGYVKAFSLLGQWCSSIDVNMPDKTHLRHYNNKHVVPVEDAVAECWMRDAGCWMLDSAYGTLEGHETFNNHATATVGPPLLDISSPALM